MESKYNQNEIEYQDKIADLLNKKLVENKLSDKYIAKRGESVIYELYLNENLKLNVKNLEKPSRGHGAFETDVTIFLLSEGISVPFIIIEIKNNISSHDIITYSHKAMKHKQVYPFLRYGLIAYGIDSIPERFFKHNNEIDFFLTIKNFLDDEKEFSKILYELFLKEKVNMDKLAQINKLDKKYNYFQRVSELNIIK